MLFKRDREEMNNPLRKLGENQRNVNIMAFTALTISLITLIVVIGMAGGSNANR